MGMDRNQVIGIILLVAMFIGWTMWSSTKENATLGSNVTDTTQVQAPVALENSEDLKATVDTNAENTVSRPEAKTLTISTKELEVVLSSEGGKIKQVTLLNWTDYKNDTLILMDEKSANYRLFGDTKKSGDVDLMASLYSTEATSTVVKEGDSTLVKFSYRTDSGALIEQIYTFKGTGYTIGYQLLIDGFSKEFASGDLKWKWEGKMKRFEKSFKDSEQLCTINYFDVDKDFDDIGTGNSDEELDVDLKWFSLKQRFFNIGFITEDRFKKARFETVVLRDDSNHVNTVSAEVLIPTNGDAYKGNFLFFFGPNDIPVVAAVTEGYENNVYLGWPIFSVINRWVVIPIFNFLEGYTHNYGLIIFILVIIIKMLLFPIAYRSYLSMAKMKVLKPELDEIKEKLNGDQQKFQLESMALYREVGVNPLSGCIPVVLQMPILLALFRFFPSAIHLRHESFLWANDLSTYDDIISWGFELPLIGMSHLSIFTLLMTASQIVYTYYNNQINVQANNQMKYIGYVMPVMFLFILNSFSSGLTYYYFISNLITITQQLVATKFIDKEKLKVVMDANRKKKATEAKAGASKKSGFQQRLEEAMKAQQEKRKQ